MAERAEDWFVPFSITFSRSHLKFLYESAVLAVVFGHYDALFMKIYTITLSQDHVMVRRLQNSYPIHIEFDASLGQLTVRNYETEEENKGRQTDRNSKVTYQ